MAIVDKEEVSKSFEEGSYFVKSYTQRLLHVVSTKSAGNTLCDKACERHINVGFCSYAIVVALNHLKNTCPKLQLPFIKKFNKRTSGRKNLVQGKMRSLP